MTDWEPLVALLEEPGFHQLLFRYLVNLEYTGWRAAIFPKTEARRDLQHKLKPHWARWLQYLCMHTDRHKAVLGRDMLPAPVSVDGEKRPDRQFIRQFLYVDYVDFCKQRGLQVKTDYKDVGVYFIPMTGAMMKTPAPAGSTPQ